MKVGVGEVGDEVTVGVATRGVATPLTLRHNNYSYSRASNYSYSRVSLLELEMVYSYDFRGLTEYTILFLAFEE